MSLKIRTAAEKVLMCSRHIGITVVTRRLLRGSTWEKCHDCGTRTTAPYCLSNTNYSLLTIQLVLCNKQEYLLDRC